MLSSLNTLSTNDWIALALGIVLVIAAVYAVIALASARRRHNALRQRFGLEYEREVEHQGSVRRAERELIAREKRVQENLRPLAEADRVRFSGDWRNVQERFVDDPSGAVQSASELIKAVMLARGYAIERFDQRVEDLSVEHSSVLDHYRAAHDLAVSSREGRATTEDMRQAMVHYRALFADLMEQATAQSFDPRLAHSRA
jgi:hypothetical protein